MNDLASLKLELKNKIKDIKILKSQTKLKLTYESEWLDSCNKEFYNHLVFYKGENSSIRKRYFKSKRFFKVGLYKDEFLRNKRAIDFLISEAKVIRSNIKLLEVDSVEKNDMYLNVKMRGDRI